MPRARDPRRDEAYEIFRASGGKMPLVQIAEKLGLPEGTIRGWKAKDRWDDILAGKKTKKKERNVPNKRMERNDLERNANEISWADIETEYVTDIRKKPVTLEQLAKKYGISHGYMMQYAAEHNWTEKRRKNLEEAKKNSAVKTLEKISNDISKVTARHLKISDQLLKIIEDALNDEDEFYKVVERIRTGYGPGEFKDEIVVERVNALNDAKLKNIVESFERLQKAQRQTLAILDEKDRRKLELEEKKAAGEGVADSALVDDWVESVIDQ